MTQKLWHVLTVVLLAVTTNGIAAADMGRLVKSTITIDSNGSSKSHHMSLDRGQ